MSLAELVMVTNKIYDLTISPRRTNTDIMIAHQISCDFLTKLSRDTEFFQNVLLLNQLQLQNQNAFNQITGVYDNSIDHFNNFLNLEEKLLLDAGLRSELVKTLVIHAKQSIIEVRKGTKTLQEVHGIVNVLRQKSCQLAIESQRNITLITGIKYAETKLWSICFGLSGAAVITVNAAPAIIGDITLSLAGMAVSGSVGSSLLERGLNLMLDNNHFE